MPVKTALFKPAVSQLLGQLIQVGLVAAIWSAELTMTAGLKIIDFSGQASFATASLVRVPSVLDQMGDACCEHLDGEERNDHPAEALARGESSLAEDVLNVGRCKK